MVTFITIQQARRQGVQLRPAPMAGRWWGRRPGSNVTYNVYDPRLWNQVGPGLRRRMWSLQGRLGQETGPAPVATLQPAASNRWVLWGAIGVVLLGTAYFATSPQS